ncbi:MAG: hypothetical protein IT210_09690 [Armatimonadetes bacterium]|nr:hypothetical protein [Armatimonadota bacterium]
MEDDSIGVSLSRKQIHHFYRILWLSNGIFFLMTAFLRMPWLRQLQLLVLAFDLDTENSVATWYSSLLLAYAGLLALIHFGICVRNNRACRLRFGWLAMAAILLLMSCDEVVGIHEGLTETSFRETFGRILGLRATWPLILFPAIVATMFFMVLFYRRVMASIQGVRLYFISALALWSSSIFLEALPRTFLYDFTQVRKVLQLTLEPVEEGVELAAATLIIMAFIEMIRFNIPQSKPSQEDIEAAARLVHSDSHIV